VITSGAGDCLVDLTSRDGDWFLDEMYLVSTLVIELASLLPSHHQLDSNTGADTRVELVLQCLKSAHNIYKGLQVFILISKMHIRVSKGPFYVA
jgi:PI-3-kinase-related kinase SMG-1